VAAAKTADPATAPAAAPAPPPAAPARPAATRITGKNFVLDVASPGCRASETCAVTLRVSTTGEFHVNKEYPYKFTASAVPEVTFLGSGDANVFSRASGDFREDGEKTGTMTVRFKAAKAGEAKVAGTYKMSVCSADQCQIEAQAVALSVPVM
ncbi:MAG: hypothetical protein JWP97_3732, partial [Labilithrix sp.]|nr:hypothetical protein [Labilithrix sp.]